MTGSSVSFQFQLVFGVPSKVASMTLSAPLTDALEPAPIHSTSRWKSPSAPSAQSSMSVISPRNFAVGQYLGDSLLQQWCCWPLGSFVSHLTVKPALKLWPPKMLVLGTSLAPNATLKPLNSGVVVLTLSRRDSSMC